MRSSSPEAPASVRHSAKWMSAGLAAGALAAAPAALAQPPRPTLAFDRPCYGEQEAMVFSGQQYSPGGQVGLTFAANGVVGTYGVVADAGGAIAGRVGAPEPDAFMREEEQRTDVSVTANDQTRLSAGVHLVDPLATFAAVELQFSRTWGSVGSRAPRPGRPFFVLVHGWAEAAGSPLYLHYVRRGRSRSVTDLGTLGAPCGDLRRRVPRAFPFRAAPGRYRLYLTTDPADPTGGPGYFRFAARVPAGGSARAAAVRGGRARLHRAGAAGGAAAIGMR